MIATDERPDENAVSSAPSGSADRRSVLLVLLLTVGLCAASIALLGSGQRITESAMSCPWWAVIGIAVGFGLAEHFAFQFEYRRGAISFSMSEVPTVYALAFLSPVVAVAVRMVSSVIGIAIALRARPPALKSWFNSSLFALEMSLAFVIVRGVADTSPLDGGRFLVAASLAVLVATFVGSIFVSLAITCFEGDLAGRIRTELRTGSLTAPLGALVAATALAPSLFGLIYAPLAIVPVIAVWLVLLHHGRLTRHYHDLTSLHAFAGVISRTLRLTEIGPAAVEESRELLHAGRVWLGVIDADGRVMTWASGSSTAPLPKDAHDALCLLISGEPVAFGTSVSGAADDDRESGFERIVAPVRDSQGIFGIVIVDDRSGLVDRFDRRDIERTQTLVEQLVVSLRKALLHASIEHAALHDGLTGERNRVAFDQIVTAALSEPRNAAAAVMMLDLDQFKEVNDTLGHQFGDRVLVEFASRMRGVLQPDDVFARFGGDEFAIFSCRTDIAALRELASALYAETLVPIALDAHDIVVSASIGVAVVADHDRDAVEVLRRADIAMFSAKKGHEGVAFYREEIDRRTPERLALVGDLRTTVDRGELLVHFQPKIDLMTSTVIGAEALVRWQHPSRGWVDPEEFIRVAEETGLIKQLTEQVLITSIRTVQSWSRQGYDLSVAVNLSTVDLLDELLAERISHRLEQYGVDPSRLTLEITESSLMFDAARAMNTIERLTLLGVQLSLDDFGTGYSSLTYLRRLPVDELKIDRSFVTNMLLDGQDEVIVRSTIDLGHNLGLKVVAEGVENSPVLDRLIELGCDLAQGYGISRPLPAHHLQTWLSTTPFQVRRSCADRSERRAATDVHAGPVRSIDVS